MSEKIETILKDNGATADELDAASRASAADGTDLIFVAQLGKTADDARKAAQGLSKNSKVVDALVAAWTSENKAAGGGQQVPPPPPPPPPPPAGQQGTITRGQAPPAQSADIVANWPSITVNPGSLDQQTFQIPALLANGPAGPTDPVQVDNLQWTDWVHVAYNCNLTKARKLTPTGIDLPRLAAFKWKLQPDPGFCDVVTPAELKDGGLTTSLTFTSTANAHFTKGVFDGALNFSYLFVTASADAHWQEKASQQQAARRVYLGFQDLHPVCRLHLQSCLEVSDLLTARIQATLATQNDDDAFESLIEILDDFGHVVPPSVVLGEAFVFQNTRNIQQWNSAKESDIKLNFSLACTSKNSKTKTPAGPKPGDKKAPGPSGDGKAAPGGGLDISWDSMNADWASSDNLEERLQAYPVGGNEDSRSWTDWVKTLGKPQGWRVIVQEGMSYDRSAPEKTRYYSIFEFIPDPSKRIQGIWLSGCNKAWDAGGPRLAAKKPDYTYFQTPAFWTPGGVRPVTMLNRAAGASRVLQASNGVSDQMPAARNRVIPEQPAVYNMNVFKVGPVPAQNVPQVPIEQAGSGRSSGTYWVHIDPAPLRISEALAADAKENSALWKFEYTGDVGLDGIPLYWIITQDEKWMLSGFTQTDAKTATVAHWAALVPADQVRKLMPAGAPTAWIIYPADPCGLRGEDYEDHFLIWNPLLGGFLGDQIDVTSYAGWREQAHREYSLQYTPGRAGGRGVVPGGWTEVYQDFADKDFIESTTTVKRTSIVTKYKGFGDVGALSVADFDAIAWRIQRYNY